MITELKGTVDISPLDEMLRELLEVPDGFRLRSITCWGGNNYATVVYERRR